MTHIRNIVSISRMCTQAISNNVFTSKIGNLVNFIYFISSDSQCLVIKATRHNLLFHGLTSYAEFK